MALDRSDFLSVMSNFALFRDNEMMSTSTWPFTRRNFHFSLYEHSPQERRSGGGGGGGEWRGRCLKSYPIKVLLHDIFSSTFPVRLHAPSQMA